MLAYFFHYSMSSILTASEKAQRERFVADVWLLLYFPSGACMMQSHVTTEALTR